ncbi:MAG: DNA adenine methylase [Ruminococcus sp.]|nr:DNA adenine methylase [Ruminococcus sp.]
MSWVGGKKALRDAIIDRFPLYYERYIEVFGGAGWVLFRKPMGLDMEVWNDRNSNLINLYRCVREQPYLLKEKLRYCLNTNAVQVLLSHSPPLYRSGWQFPLRNK